MSERLGHVAIIDDNPGRGEKREFSPAEAVRYRERSSVERVNSHLHDEHGGRHVRVFCVSSNRLKIVGHALLRPNKTVKNVLHYSAAGAKIGA